jgi:hypothetical protein
MGGWPVGWVAYLPPISAAFYTKIAGFDLCSTRPQKNLKFRKNYEWPLDALEHVPQLCKAFQTRCRGCYD